MNKIIREIMTDELVKDHILKNIQKFENLRI